MLTLKLTVGAVIASAAALVSGQSQPDCGRPQTFYEDACWVGTGKIYAVRYTGATWPYPASSIAPWTNLVGCLRADGLLGNETDGCATFSASGTDLSSTAGNIGVEGTAGSAHLSAAGSASHEYLSTLLGTNEWTGVKGSEFDYERKYLAYGVGYVDWSIDAVPGASQTSKVWRGGSAATKVVLLFHGCQSSAGFYPNGICDAARACASC